MGMAFEPNILEAPGPLTFLYASYLKSSFSPLESRNLAEM